MEVRQRHLNKIESTLATDEMMHLQQIKLKTIPKFNKTRPL